MFVPLAHPPGHAQADFPRRQRCGPRSGTQRQSRG
jgi:hypothetical protein